MKTFYACCCLFLLLLSSCAQVQETENPKPATATIYSNVLILGNSIVRHSALESIGWTNDWGMAASSQEKDFVHILDAKLKAANPSAKLSSLNIAEWENSYWSYDVARFDTLAALQPDLLIIRLGDNVDNSQVQSRQRDFGKHLAHMIDYIATEKTKVLLTGPFWTRPNVQAAMVVYSRRKNITFVDLTHLNRDEYKAIGLFSNPDVANHPSDKGMEAIANAIWKAVN